jgi:4-amino-4-deoxy-L-arabinose transferase-like glycosyltransferase
MLAKGAVGALLPGAAALLQLASLRRLSLLLRPAWCLPGAVALLGIGLSWYLLLGATRADGFHFMTELFLEHHLDRFTSPKEGHHGPVFYYLPVLLIALAPWSAFLPLALARRFAATDARGRWLRLLGLLSAVTLVFFSLAATKLPHYAFPALPGLALCIADRLARANAAPSPRALAWSVAACLVLLVALGIGLLATPAIAAALPAWLGSHAAKAPELAYPIDLGPALPAAAFAALATAAAVFARRKAPVALAGRLGLGMLLVWACVAWGVMPRWDHHFLRPLRDLTASALARDTSGERLLLVGLRRRPSIVFHGGRGTEYASPRDFAGLLARLSGPPPRLALTTDATFARLARNARFEAIERDTGYVLFRAAPPPAPGARASGADATLNSPGDATP